MLTVSSYPFRLGVRMGQRGNEEKSGQAGAIRGEHERSGWPSAGSALPQKRDYLACPRRRASPSGSSFSLAPGVDWLLRMTQSRLQKVPSHREMVKAGGGGARKDLKQGDSCDLRSCATIVFCTVSRHVSS